MSAFVFKIVCGIIFLKLSGKSELSGGIYEKWDYGISYYSCT